MQEALVSILIPSYNARKYLEETVDSAMRQTHRHVEIIIVDDGSTDDSLAAVRHFKGDRVKVIAQTNQGQPSALNKAFEASTGSYIQYLDADDILHPDKISAQMDRLQRHPDAIASGSWARFRSDIAEAVFEPEPVWRDLDPISWLVESWRGGGMMHVAGWLIPREIVDAAGPWVRDFRWAANVDAEFFTRALLTANQCLFCADAKSYYRSVANSQSTLRSAKNLKATLDVLLETGEALLSKENSLRTRCAFADNLQRFVHATFPDERELTVIAESRLRELGGSRLPFTGGPISVAAAKYVGWKASKQLHRAVRRHILR